MNDGSLFLLSWDIHGLEACVDLTEIDKHNMWATLSDGKTSTEATQIFQSLMLRARSNPQRHYEIYSVWVAEGINESTLRQQFEEMPQQMADLIRERGTKLYSDRAKTSNIRIT